MNDIIDMIYDCCGYTETAYLSNTVWECLLKARTQKEKGNYSETKEWIRRALDAPICAKCKSHIRSLQ